MRFLLLPLLFSQLLHAQTFSVRGVVTDRETRTPIPFAHVFLSNTTHVSITDNDGHFRLANLHAGQFQLVVSFLGYETFMQSITVDQTEQRIEVHLQVQAQSLDNVVVQSGADRAWARNLKTFRKYFLGEANGRHCKLVNPWVLDFEKKGTTLRASAAQPLAIENSKTGYRMFFYLTHFEASPEAYAIVGPVRFQELRQDDPEVVDQNRTVTFQGSVKHFLTSLSNGKLKDDGFKLYWPQKGQAARVRSPYFERELSFLREVGEADVSRKLSDGSFLTVPTPLEVHYQNGRDFRPLYKDVLHQVSWIQSTTGVVRFDRDGNITNPKDVVVSGYWHQSRVADMLPLDFTVTKKGPSALPDEKMKVVTTQDVYRPGDKMWYTVFVNGAGDVGASVRVHLLDSANREISSRIDPVEFGRATGYFDLPANRCQTYFIRAITKRGFEEGRAYIKPVVALPMGYTWGSDSLQTTSSALKIAWQSDTTGATRTLRLGLVDREGDSLAGNFLVRVNAGLHTDTDFAGRERSFAKPGFSKTGFNGCEGRVTGRGGRPLKGKLSMLTSDLSFSVEKETDGAGFFTLDDVVVYDSVEWLVQFFNKRKKLVAKFDVTWTKDATLTDIPNLSWPIAWRAGQCESVVAPAKGTPVADPEFPFGDARVLKEVTVKARRMNSEVQTFQSHGSPQYVVKGSDLTQNLAGTNVLSALNGRVPGLIGIEGGNSWTGYSTRFNARGNSSLFQTTEEAPLVLVDGMPIVEYSQAYDLLQTIPLTDIDRVEVRTGISPLQGMKKGSGTIAVYTKRDGTNATLAKPAPVFVKKLSMKGYSHPPSFVPGGYQESGTVHWEPYAPLEPGVPYSLQVPRALTQVTVSIFGTDGSGQEVELTETIAFEP